MTPVYKNISPSIFFSETKQFFTIICFAAGQISTTSTHNEVSDCFSLYHTDTKKLV